MEAVAVVFAFVVLGILAPRFGVDSRRFSATRREGLL